MKIAMNDPIKFVVVCGDPRDEGALAVSKAILEEAKKVTPKEISLQTELIHLKDMNILPCLHCDHCKDPDLKMRTGYYCIHRDDAEDIYETILYADALILVSPIVNRLYSSQIKVLWDRLRPVWDGMKRRLAVGDVVMYADDPNPGMGFAQRSFQHLTGPLFRTPMNLWFVADLAKAKAGPPIFSSYNPESGKLESQLERNHVHQLATRAIFGLRFLRAGLLHLKIEPKEMVHLNRPIIRIKTGETEIDEKQR
ncbi:MAG: flavodoxin family protein [Candidatus Ranarchaeia archaeon]|jgi:NAD(P)H-dependent FMN reductase